MHGRRRLVLRRSDRLSNVIRQSLIAVFAMALVLAVAGIERLGSKSAAAKVQIAGAVTQWSEQGTGGKDSSVTFRVGGFPFDLGIEAPDVALLGRHGVTQPVRVGTQVEAIVTEAEVVKARARVERGESAGPDVPVLALRVNGQPMFGSPEAFRLAPTVRMWPYLLMMSAFGAMIFFQRGRTRRSRRVE